ncbi:NfeD family protein [Clostridium guangxiense]|uniref:NfeD family protein n=2 Tax=Clostridium TaxID=1485 RepID=UPI001E61E961|nr:NfeD family protein [Clostridium guangxiense]
MDTIFKVWIFIFVVMIFIDIATSGFLFVWFSIGAAGAIITHLLGGSVIAQVIVFAVISIICFIFGYPMAKKIIKSTVKRTPLMEEKYIGKELVAERDIEETSKIMVGGIYWTVENIGHPIKRGEKFVITGIKGNKFLITK